MIPTSYFGPCNNQKPYLNSPQEFHPPQQREYKFIDLNAQITIGLYRLKNQCAVTSTLKEFPPFFQSPFEAGLLLKKGVVNYAHRRARGLEYRGTCTWLAIDSSYDDDDDDDGRIK